MTDKELFLEVLNRFADQYDLEVEQPFNDGYFKITKHGEVIGGINIDGYNLLYCLSRLCGLLKDELL